MEEDRKWGGVGGEDDQLGGASIEGFGGFVRAFLELSIVAGLLDGVENLLRQCLVGDGPGGTWVVGHACGGLVWDSFGEATK